MKPVPEIIARIKARILHFPADPILWLRQGSVLTAVCTVDEMRTVIEHIGDLERVIREQSKMRCSFCGTAAEQVRKLLSSTTGSYICNACVAVCVGVLGEVKPKPVKAGKPKKGRGKSNGR